MFHHLLEGVVSAATLHHLLKISRHSHSQLLADLPNQQPLKRSLCQPSNQLDLPNQQDLPKPLVLKMSPQHHSNLQRPPQLSHLPESSLAGLPKMQLSHPLNLLLHLLHSLPLLSLLQGKQRVTNGFLHTFENGLIGLALPVHQL